MSEDAHESGIAGYMKLSRWYQDTTCKTGVGGESIRVAINHEDFAFYKERPLGDSIEWKGQTWIFDGLI